MTKETKKPARLLQAEKDEIIRLRIAGHSIRNIAASVDRSTKSVLAVLHDSPTELSSLTAERLKTASDTFNEMLDSEWLGLASSRQYRRLLNQLDMMHGRIEQGLIEPDVERYSQLARANASQAAALASMAKAYSFVLPKPAPKETTELPKLTVHIMDSEDVRRMRQAQAEEAKLLGITE